MLRQTFEKEDTMKMKLELSNELKLHLKQMKEALAGVSLEGLNSISYPQGGCGGVCRITCSNYCRPDCFESCDSGCSDIMAAACELRMIYPWPI
jgi:hypothetical protein